MSYELPATAEKIVVQDGAQLESQFRAHTARTILSLQDQFERIRRDVLARYRPKLGALTIDQEEALTALTLGLANNIAEFPISEMKRAAEAKNGNTKNGERVLISAVRRIFRVTDVHAEELVLRPRDPADSPYVYSQGYAGSSKGQPKGNPCDKPVRPESNGTGKRNVELS